MRTVFLGTPQVSIPSLRALAHAGHDVRLVVTRPDRPSGRSRRPAPPPAKQEARRLGIEVVQPTKVKTRAFLDELARRDPEVLVVVAYGRILPGSVLRLAPRGAVNVHFSLLPRYRGAAPVQWALANGEPTTGVTTMKINERMDEGDILLQTEIRIRDGEHAPSLQARLAEVGADLLIRTLRELEAGTLEGRAQNGSEATYAPLIGGADGEVDPTLSAAEIAGRVRGFDPWPGVWLGRSGHRIRLIEAEDTGRVETSTEPGEVLDLDAGGLLMACGGGTVLRVIRLQPEGRRTMTARDAVNGRHVCRGDRLEWLGGARA